MWLIALKKLIKNLLVFKNAHNSRKLSESAQTFCIAEGHQYVSENAIKIGGDFRVNF